MGLLPGREVETIQVLLLALVQSKEHISVLVFFVYAAGVERYYLLEDNLNTAGFLLFFFKIASRNITRPD